MCINYINFYYRFYYLLGGRRTNGGLNHFEATRSLTLKVKNNEITVTEEMCTLKLPLGL